MAEELDAEALLEFMYLAPIGIMSFRNDGAIEMANPVAVQLLMPLAPDAEMADFYRVLSGLMPDLRTRVARFNASYGVVCDQMQLAVAGTRTVLALTVNKIGPDRLMASIQDISRVVEQESRIRDDQLRFGAILEHVREYAIYTVDLEGRIDAWNRSLQRVGGWEPGDVEGKRFDGFIAAGEEAQGRALLERARQRCSAEAESWRIRKDGSRFWGNTVATALPDAAGCASGYIMVTRDLTDRKRMEDRLREISLTDPLTGASNRRAGEVRLAEAFRGWQRNGRMFAVLMVDCDYFKLINDRWGHSVGDEVLIALVRICLEHLRGVDVTFRWGGEEFLVLLPGSNSAAAVAVAERVRVAVATATLGGGEREIRITVSVGVAEACKLDTSSNDILRRVDRALYQAKAAGRNRVAAE